MFFCGYNFSQGSRTLARIICPAALLVFLLLLLSVGLPLNAEENTAPTSPADEAELFKFKCGKCHDPDLALTEYRSEEVWRDTITRMREVNNADISKEDAQSLITYHVERQKREAAIFKEKCEKCHPGKVFLGKSLSEEQVRSIIKRMQQKPGSTIEEKDIDTIVKYHARSRRAAIMEGLQPYMENLEVQAAPKQTISMQEGLALFSEKCAECHELQRALSVFKDPEVWEQTIKRMQYYSKGEITDEQVKRLVGFHVTEQERELYAFRTTCTKCHDEARINNKSMSDEQWLATIRRMQQKAPELISDEKVSLLAAYFHRRELTMAKIFSGKCRICHYGVAGEADFQASQVQLGALIVYASDEIGDALQLNDIESLVYSHTMRQLRNMQLFRQECTTCHPDGPPGREEEEKEEKAGRSRAEWITYIATLQGLELNKDIQSTISSQIDYHIKRQQPSRRR